MTRPLSMAVLAGIIRNVEPGGTVTAASPMAGGMSSCMTVVTLKRADGGEHRLVIRRGRRGDSERRSLSIGAEYSLVDRLLALGLPVARPRLFDGSRTRLPSAYAVYDYVDGAPCLRSGEPERIGQVFAEGLVAIHAIDPTDLGRVHLPDQVDTVEARVLRSDSSGHDDSLQEALVRRRLAATWPPPAGRVSMLHGDYFPGNVLWRDDDIVAVIDWEDAAVGDPLSDVATTRLDLLWVFGPAAMEAFTARYVELTGADTTALPVWELVAALRPAGEISAWAGDWAALGRPDIDSSTMRAAHRSFVDDALARQRVLSRASPRTP